MNRLRFMALGLIAGGIVCAVSAQTDTSSGRQLKGTAVDADGQPVEGATVQTFVLDEPLSAGGRDAKSNQPMPVRPDGTFTLDLPSGNVTVLVRKSGLAPAWKQFMPAKDDQEERFVLTKPTSIAGTVTDEADQPVADAEVYVSLALQEIEVGANRRTFAWLNQQAARECFHAQTDANGHFRIDGVPTTITADLDVHAQGKALHPVQRDYVGPDTLMCRAGAENVQLKLEPAGTLEGRITTDEPSVAPPKARLTLTLQASGMSGNQPQIESRADGTFSFTELPAGNYVLNAIFGTNDLPDWVAESARASIEAGQATKDVQVTATRGGVLHTRLLSKGKREPVAGATVSVFRDSYRTGVRTDSNGEAILRLPAGEYQVTAYQSTARTEAASTAIEKGQTNQLELTLNPPPRIAGTVRDPDGKPVGGLPIVLFPNYLGPDAGRPTTDAEGHYEMEWDPNRFAGINRTFCLIARDTNRNLATAVELDPESSTLDLQLEPALTITGQVKDTAGSPLPEAGISLYLWTGNMGSSIDRQTVTTDANGKFEIRALPPGRRYSLSATAEGFGSASQQIEAEDTAEEKQIDLEPFTLDVADQILAGQVVDEDDNPVANAWVRIYGDGQPNSSTRTDAEGRFRFDAVCAGTVRISANSQRSFGNAGAQAGETNVVLQLGVNQSVEISRPRRTSLKGRPLPDLAPFGIKADATPAGRPLLLCLLDAEQRPSRRTARLLAEQAETLKNKGVLVIAIQAARASNETFEDWTNASQFPFPVGRAPESSAETKWATSVPSMPWLILRDASGKVATEGFGLEELEAKVAGLHTN